VRLRSQTGEHDAIIAQVPYAIKPCAS